MAGHNEIRIVGRSGTRLTLLEDILQSNSQYTIKRQLVVELDSESLAEARSADVLILDLSEKWQDELLLLAELKRKSDRAPTIVVGVDEQKQMIKMAMKAGACDFYAHPIPAVELIESINHICAEEKQFVRKESSISVVMHGKGGAGASFFASNFAHMLATEPRKPSTMLLDLNLLTGELPLYFDLTDGGDLRQAVEYIDNIDELALQAFIMKHHSGVELMSSSGQPSDTVWNVTTDKYSTLVAMLASNYEQIIIDLPNPTEPGAHAIVQQADRIFIVIQQNLMDLHSSKRLLTMLDFQAVSRDRVHIIINRYDKHNAVRFKDIEGALDGVHLHCVPNDYKRVSESINTGVPLGEKSRNAPITASIRKIAYQVLGFEQGATGVIGTLRRVLGGKQ